MKEQIPMLTQNTLNTLKTLRLPGMVAALEEQHCNASSSDLSFDERLGLLVDRELAHRDNRRIARLLREAKLKAPLACVEDIRYGAGRKLDKAAMVQFGSCQWIRAQQNLIVTGATGCGKTWLACALGNAACRQGLSVAYVRAPRLFEELHIMHADGSFGKRLSALAKTDLLILDDWALNPLNQAGRADLLEILDDRVGTRSTLITSQLPTEHWHGYLNDPTLADAILDRVLHSAHKITLAGESLRKPSKDNSKDKIDAKS
jgi:DNA replication protein DnaC